MNNVVLGDLSLDSRDDALALDGLDDTIVVSTGDIVRHEVSMCDVDSQTIHTLFSTSDGYIWIYKDPNSSIFNVRLTTSSGEKFLNMPSELVVSSCYDIVVERVSGGVFIEINGVNITFPYTPVATSGITVGVRGGSYYAKLKATIKRIHDGTYSYIKNGDFGSISLPSTPSGNDGTINGAHWWKVGVDGKFQYGTVV